MEIILRKTWKFFDIYGTQTINAYLFVL